MLTYQDSGPVFSHGQLHIALSRATAKRNTTIIAIKHKAKDYIKISKKQKRQT
jgi:hypothetical protein